MSTRHEVRDDDEVRFPDNGLTASGEALRRLVEDMFGTTVHTYIKDAQLGRQFRRMSEERKDGVDEPSRG
jgi:hypothetical protein